jgi:hypothetical protein
MHTAGQQLVEVAVEEAVVRDNSARRNLAGASCPVEFEFGDGAGFRERQAQVACVGIERGGEGEPDTVHLDLDYQGPNVEALVEPAAVRGREPEQRPIRVRRSRKNAVADLADAPEESVREHTLVFQRELADILACVFAEAQAAGRLDALVGSESQNAEMPSARGRSRKR